MTNLTDRGSAITREVAAVGETALRNLEDRSNALIDALQDRSRAVVNLFEDRSEGMLTSLQDRTMELTSVYTQSTDALRVAIDEGTTRAVSTLVGTNDRLRGELSGVLDRLHEANRVLQQIASSATGNLGAIEDGLSGRVGQIEGLLAQIEAQTGRASEQVADQVDALHQVSLGAVQQAGDLARSLDERSRALSASTGAQLETLKEAAETLERIEQRVDAALNGRQSALDALLSRIGERSADLETVTKSFTASIEGSLQNADLKARQIGSVLAGAAESTTSAIGEQFDRIRETTGAESERTTAALRAAYDTATAEMQTALTGATAKFRDTMGELRGMTEQVQRELESTRAELRRGVVELPQETQESTANMRRVVAEQIRALNELSALVSRSNRAVDAAPAAPPRRVNEAPAATLAIASDVRRSDAPVAVVAAPMPVTARFAEPQTPPSPATGPARPAPASDRPAQRREEASPSREGMPRSGWLSDLLNRASRDEQQGQPRPTGRQDRSRINSLESLDSISVDIARMIDHDAAVELWDRYKRGESNVFTRRLYTIQGQQTFDEIRRKYRGDTEFKQTVDRYVEEFERLIAEVSRDERGSALANTYLTSETGKVYTMLAHASGRFD